MVVKVASASRSQFLAQWLEHMSTSNKIDKKLYIRLILSTAHVFTWFSEYCYVGGTITYAHFTDEETETGK